MSSEPDAAGPSSSIDYRNKLILAPMVRVGTLPMRLLALDYGADLVYCEEIVDLSILRCQRNVNTVLNTVDYCVDGEKYPIFRTCEKEKSKVVFQMGTCNPENAVCVAKLVENDVAAIDVNMGCPKSFSLQGGMGAALLDKPLLIKEILTSLVEASLKPVTCKIRVLPSEEDTLELCRLIERTGVAALTVHGRTKDERPRHPNRNGIIRRISEAVGLPVIANGGSSQILQYDDIAKFKEETGCSSVMMARVAMENASIFRPQGMDDEETVIRNYLKHSVTFDNCPPNTKYTIQQMLRERQQTTELGREFLKAPTVREMCQLWNLEDFWLTEKSRQRERLMRAQQSRSSCSCCKAPSDANADSDKAGVSRTELNGVCFVANANVISAEVEFIRRYFDSATPKSFLHDFCRLRRIALPKYETTQRPTDKKFQSTVCIAGLSEKSFRSTHWERNSRSSEQAAVIVALAYLGELLMLDFLPSQYKDIDFD